MENNLNLVDISFFEDYAEMAERFDQLISERRYREAKEEALRIPAPDLAAIFGEMAASKMTLIFRLLPKELAAETFVDMEAEEQYRLIESFSDSELSEILDELYIDDTTGINVTAMKGKLRRVKNLGLIIVDYLQLMETEKKRKDGSRVNEVAEITRGLKIMGKELGVPIIVCSQLSRGTDKEKKRPVLSDLRESGSIEQDADMVLFLSRDYYGEDPEKANLVEVIIAKNRHGETGTVEMSWLGQYTKFSTLSTDMREE